MNGAETCRDVGEWTHPFPVRSSRGFPVSRLRRVLSRTRRQPVPQPWEWERLATPDEIACLRQTDMRKAA